ncbi:MAG TPA: hypothetical protein VHB79_19560 [Polyangiaceae bacterium]|nr:hypothetical protein [Polyangiaceae bacterium]
MFQKSFYSLVLVGLVATVEPHLALAQGGASALSIEEDRRRTLYQQGKEAIKAQHWVDAKTRLTDAWTIRPSYDVALSLSQAEFNLGQFDESARHLAYYFKNVSAKENENNLANAKQAFEAAKAKVSSVEVTAPRGADILVDGKELGIAPLDGNTFVKPGRRVFEARLGEAKAQQELQAVAGQEQQVTLKLEEPSKPAPAVAAAPAAPVDAGLPQPPAPAAPEPPRKRSLVPAYVGAGVAAVGIGVGIGFALAAGSDKDDIDALKRKNGSSGCLDSTSGDCAAQHDAAEARDRHLTYEVIGFSVAGAAVIGTAAYLLWPSSSSATATTRNKLTVSGGASPDGARIWVLGNF